MRLALLVVAGSAAGGLLRYLVSVGLARALGPGFPWGTLAVNAAGCFAIGVVNAAALEAGALSEGARVALAVGLLGGLTTFSSFGFETVRLLEAGRPAAAAANAAGNLLLGLALAWLGLRTGRALFG